MPPSGEEKAAAMPAAAPMATHERCCTGRRSSSSGRVIRLFSREMHEATHAPTCTIGPSRPSGSPEATTRVVPSTLTRRVRGRRMSTRQPLRKAFSRGSPEPKADGSHSVSATAPRMSTRPHTTEVTRARATEDDVGRSPALAYHMTRSTRETRAECSSATATIFATAITASDAPIVTIITMDTASMRIWWARPALKRMSRWTRLSSPTYW